MTAEAMLQAYKENMTEEENMTEAAYPALILNLVT